MKYTIKIIEKPSIGRPYVFNREDFIKEKLEYEPEEVSTEAPNHFTSKQGDLGLDVPAADEDSDDLPF